MAASEPVAWKVCERCVEDGGIGVRLPNCSRSWAHTDGQDLDEALKRLGSGGRLDTRGVPITGSLLSGLLSSSG